MTSCCSHVLLRPWVLPLVCNGLFLLAVSPLSYAADTANNSAPIPPAQASVLQDLATAEPQAIITRIQALPAPLHPLVVLRRAEAYYQLASTITDPTSQAATYRQAENDFVTLLSHPSHQRTAALRLAYLASLRHEWHTALRYASQAYDANDNNGETLFFIATVAVNAGDWRLASIATQQGLLRFSADPRWRRLDLAVLLQAQRADEAHDVIRALLVDTPNDQRLWQQLAWANQQRQRPADASAALEAALLTAPGDSQIRYQLAQQQAELGQPHAALATLAPLTAVTAEQHANPTREKALLLAIRCALATNQPACITQARAWLAGFTPVQQPRDYQLLNARAAVMSGDVPTAYQALTTLVRSGESDLAILLWAGSVAEQHGDDASAEAWYLRTCTGTSANDHPATSAATLRLAGLYLRQRRISEAITLLNTYLVKKPEDQNARRLLEHLTPRP